MIKEVGKEEAIYVTTRGFADMIGLSTSHVRNNLMRNEAFKKHVRRHGNRILIKRNEALEVFEKTMLKPED